jgi:DNA-binding CsgD family transcriptional regulator
MPQSRSSSLKPFFTPQVWDVLSQQLKLSKREVQMLKALFDDKSEAGIARDLGLSPHTVRTYMERLHGKVGVKSRTALMTAVLGEFLKAVIQPNSPLSPICAKRAQGECPFQR